MDKQSVRIGVDKLYYALVLTDTSGGITYDTPVQLKGVTEITVTKNSSKMLHYSDDMPSEVISQDGEITVEFSIDGLTSSVKAALLGSSYSASTGLYKEGIGEAPVYIALGYRSKKANGYYKYTWFYKGSCSKSSDKNKTIAEGVTVQQDVVTFSAIKPIYYADQIYGLKQSYQSDDANAPAGLTDALLIVPETGWFSDPEYVPTAPGTTIADFAGSTGSGASGTVACTFTAPAGCTSAYIQFKEPLATEWQRATTSAAIVAASTSATITGLTPGNTYDLRLVVIGGSKHGISNVDEDVVAHT